MENPNKLMLLKGVPLPCKAYDFEAIERIQDELEFQDNDVIIVTYPKSGTHWMIEIVSLIYAKGDPTWVKAAPCWKRSPWIEDTYNIENIKNRREPPFFTSHLPIQLVPKSYFTSRAKDINGKTLVGTPGTNVVIYVARNPRDVLVSRYYFRNMSPSIEPCPVFEQFFEKFLQGNLCFGSWFDHIKGWLPMRDSEKFLLLTYEELHQDLKVSVEKICRFLDKGLSEEEISSVLENASFHIMKKHTLENNETIKIGNMEPIKIMVMRKGICGDWKDHFTVAQMEAFNQVYQEKMKGLDQELFPWDQC